jgi:hypothetical protein
MHNFGRHDGRRQNAMRVNRSPYYSAAGHHNHVDVNRIREGIDVRTTVSYKPGPHQTSLARLTNTLDHATEHPQQGRSSNVEAHC